jgi:hypothetical protein
MRKAQISAILILVSIVLVACVSCATLGLKSWSAYTPKEKALAILDAYNGQYNDTFSMASNPSITPAQKEVVRQKKATLTKVYPLIQVYVGIIESGKVPSQSQEQAILNLLNQLGSKVGG